MLCEEHRIINMGSVIHVLLKFEYCVPGRETGLTEDMQI